MRLTNDYKNLENDDIGIVYDATNKFVQKMSSNIYKKFWVYADYFNGNNQLKLLTDNEVLCVEKVSIIYYFVKCNILAWFK